MDGQYRFPKINSLQSTPPKSLKIFVATLYRRDKKLYVVDMGLDCVHVFTINDECERFGSSGEKIGEFKKPAGLVVDHTGSIVVVDSGNNRLQMLDKNWNFCGVMKVSLLPGTFFLTEVELIMD